MTCSRFMSRVSASLFERHGHQIAPRLGERLARPRAADRRRAHRSSTPARANSATSLCRNRRRRPADAWPTLPCSAKASSVFSGMVLMVSGAASASTYSVSGPPGPWCRCWPRAAAAAARPALASFCQRGDCEQLAVGLVGAHGDGDAETIAQRRRHLVLDRHVPAADEDRCHGADAADRRPAAMRRSMPRMYASAAARYCSRENSSVTLIGTPAKIDSSMAGMPARGARDLDEQIGALRPRMQLRRRLDGAGGVVQRAAARPRATPSRPRRRWLVDRPEQIGGLRQILERQLEEQRLARLARSRLSCESPRRRRRAADRLIEDRRIGGQPGDRQTRRCSGSACRSSSSPRVMLSSQRL